MDLKTFQVEELVDVTILEVAVVVNTEHLTSVLITTMVDEITAMKLLDIIIINETLRRTKLSLSFGILSALFRTFGEVKTGNQFDGCSTLALLELIYLKTHINTKIIYFVHKIHQQL